MGEAARFVARGLRQPSLQPAVIGLLAASLDFIAVALSLWFADFSASGAEMATGKTTLAAALAALLTVTVLGQARQYRLCALCSQQSGSLWLLVAGFASTLPFLLTAFWSGTPANFLTAAAITLPVAGLPARALVSAVAHWAKDYGLTERRAVVVGGGPNAASLIRGLADNPENDIRICGIFDDRDDSRSPQVVVGVPKIGTVENLLSFSRAAEIDMLIVTLPLGAEKRIREILDTVKVLPLDVRMSAFSSDYEFRRRAGDRPNRAGLIHLIRRPLEGRARLAKRGLDIAGAAAALLLLSPLMALVALAIRVDTPGPVLFRQARHGYNHKPVEILKFRSLRAEECDPEARRIVTQGDARVTRVGRFIRRWSLDELPQLFNVLKGDLSLVGPRPHAMNAVSSRQQAFEEIVQGYAARHRVPPGVTGWAQIHGWRGEIDAPESLRRRIEHDLYYIENRSLWLDIMILARTPLCLLNSGNAY